jgi:hypothetical protein
VGQRHRCGSFGATKEAEVPKKVAATAPATQRSNKVAPLSILLPLPPTMPRASDHLFFWFTNRPRVASHTHINHNDVGPQWWTMIGIDVRSLPVVLEERRERTITVLSINAVDS